MTTTPMTLEIIPADTTDLTPVSELFDLYRQFYGHSGNVPACKAFLFDRLSRQEALIFLAVQNTDSGQPQAVGFILMYPSFSSLSLSPILILNDIYIRPECRRMGVARRLMEYAHDLAREFGYTHIVLETAVSNDPAKELYESFGYRKVTDFDRYVWIMDENK